MPKTHRNTPERALMLVKRRVEQNYRSGPPHSPPPVASRASVPGGTRRRVKRADAA